MKHATESTLIDLAYLLNRIRQFDGLKEKKLGVFYKKSSAFLHFHEDERGVFADLRLGSDWERFPVNSTKEQNELLNVIATALNGSV